MELFDNFPLSNAYSVNLDWILRKMRDLETFVKNYTAVNKISVAGIWDITKQYPQWALVTSGDNSYLSNNAVPAGIPLENAEYWQKLADLDPRISGIIADLAKLPIADTSSIITLNADGGAMYNNLNAAISAAKNVASADKRCLVIIYGGEYEGQIDLSPNPGVDIVGVGDVTIRNTRQYPYSTINTVGKGTFKNLNLESNNLRNYALHIEAQQHDVAGVITFDNCSFSSADFAAVGIGTGAGFIVRFTNCRMITNAQGGASFYLHNHPAGERAISQVELFGCNLVNNGGGNNIRLENARTIYGGGGSAPLLLVLNANSLRLGKVQYYDGAKTVDYLPQTGEVSCEGSGNSNADCNKIEPIGIYGYFPVAGNGVCVISIPGCKQYYTISNYTFQDASTGGAVTPSTVTVSANCVVASGLPADKIVLASFFVNRP